MKGGEREIRDREEQREAKSGRELGVWEREREKERELLLDQIEFRN